MTKILPTLAIICLMAFTSSVQSQTESSEPTFPPPPDDPQDVPEEILTEMSDRGALFELSFTCSRYDGFAGCWKNDWQKRDIFCSQDCTRNQRWSYKHFWGGKCYCCKCN